MGWTAQWRTKGDLEDAVFVLDDSGAIRQSFLASQPVLSRFLTSMGDLQTWRGGSAVAPEGQDPESWGELVCARAGSGEVLEVEPELFWHGIYMWFRRRGVDYDSPGLQDILPYLDTPAPQKSALMDD
jgi:hypothetical protein